VVEDHGLLIIDLCEIVDLGPSIIGICMTGKAAEGLKNDETQERIRRRVAENTLARGLLRVCMGQ